MTWTWHLKNDSLRIINKQVTPATILHGSTNPVQCMKITVNTKNIIIDDFHQFCPQKNQVRLTQMTFSVLWVNNLSTWHLSPTQFRTECIPWFCKLFFIWNIHIDSLENCFSKSCWTKESNLRQSNIWRISWFIQSDQNTGDYLRLWKTKANKSESSCGQWRTDWHQTWAAVPRHFNSYSRWTSLKKEKKRKKKKEKKERKERKKSEKKLCARQFTGSLKSNP